MFITRTSRALIAALPLMAVALPALAEIKDYEFRLTQSEFKQGNGVVITVRLIDKRSGKPVPDAVIRKAWFTMSHLVLAPGSKILDMGCSDGSMAFAMAVMNPDYQFIGVDRDKNLIRHARDMYQLKNLEFICGEVGGE